LWVINSNNIITSYKVNKEALWVLCYISPLVFYGVVKTVPGGRAGWLAGWRCYGSRQAGGLIFVALIKTWLCGSWL